MILLDGRQCAVSLISKDDGAIQWVPSKSELPLYTSVDSIFRCFALVCARILLATHVMGHGSHLHKACLEWEGDRAVFSKIMQITTSSVRKQGPTRSAAPKVTKAKQTVEWRNWFPDLLLQVASPCCPPSFGVRSWKMASVRRAATHFTFDICEQFASVTFPWDPQLCSSCGRKTTVATSKQSRASKWTPALML